VQYPSELAIRFLLSVAILSNTNPWHTKAGLRAGPRQDVGADEHLNTREKLIAIQTRRRILNSELFNAARAFFPQFSWDGHTYPKLSRSESSAARDFLNYLLSKCIAAEKGSQSLLELYFHRTLPRYSHISIELYDAESPIIASEPDDNRIYFDVSVFQANLLATAVAEGSSTLFRDSDEIAAEDAATISRFFLTITELQAAHKPEAIMKILNGDLSTSEDNAYPVEQFTPMAKRFESIAMFEILHEMGHLFLRSNSTCSSAGCTGLQQDEYDADSFAALCSVVFASKEVRHSGDNDSASDDIFDDEILTQENEPKHWYGFVDFFKREYDLGGFGRQNKFSHCNCEYPSVKAREDSISKTVEFASNYYHPHK
jgi:hypothetical protein